jgi:enamine deaminase RidA (YjgF/YER057c/UK114 family)
MPSITKVKTGNPFEDKESYSRLVRIDDWILMSNTAGRHPETKIMPEDAAGQAEQVFDNMERLLKKIGSSLADVVRSRVTIPDPSDVPAIMDVVARRYKGIDPVSTVLCSALGLPHLKVEMEVTAYFGAGNMEQRRLVIPLA